FCWLNSSTEPVVRPIGFWTGISRSSVCKKPLVWKRLTVAIPSSVSGLQQKSLASFGNSRNGIGRYIMLKEQGKSRRLLLASATRALQLVSTTWLWYYGIQTDSRKLNH